MKERTRFAPTETLVERVSLTGPSRIAFVGLARGAGEVTAIRHVLAGLTERGVSPGVAAAGMRDEDLEAEGGPSTLRLELQAGAVVATTAGALSRSEAALDTLDRVECSGPTAQILIARVREPGEVEVVGPAAGPDLQRTVNAMRRHTDGPVLIEGSLKRRGFSAPGVADYLVLAVGASLAPSAERLIPAARYYLDLFQVPLAPPEAKPLYERALSEQRCLLTDRSWKPLDSFHWLPSDNAPSLLARRDMGAAWAVVPQFVADELVVPLLREGLRIGFVVRDPMRNALSPVYHAAWEKRGGGVTVVHRPLVMALVANPINPVGPDSDPREFLRELSEGLNGVPVHDVMLEARAAAPKKRWFGRRN